MASLGLKSSQRNEHMQLEPPDRLKKYSYYNQKLLYFYPKIGSKDKERLCPSKALGRDFQGYRRKPFDNLLLRETYKNRCLDE